MNRTKEFLKSKGHNIINVSGNFVPFQWLEEYRIFCQEEEDDNIFPNINQKVKRDYPESWDYWVSEINFITKEVLIRTTEKEEDPKYDDFWVKVNEIIFKPNK